MTISKQQITIAVFLCCLYFIVAQNTIAVALQLTIANGAIIEPPLKVSRGARVLICNSDNGVSYTIAGAGAENNFGIKHKVQLKPGKCFDFTTSNSEESSMPIHILDASSSRVVYVLTVVPKGVPPSTQAVERRLSRNHFTNDFPDSVALTLRDVLNTPTQTHVLTIEPQQYVIWDAVNANTGIAITSGEKFLTNETAADYGADDSRVLVKKLVVQKTFADEPAALNWFCTHVSDVRTLPMSLGTLGTIAGTRHYIARFPCAG